MSTAIQKFVNEKFNWEIRVVEINGELWFVGHDVAKALGYSNSRKALNDHVSAKFKKSGVTIRYSSSNGVEQDRSVTVINEAGLYKLVLKSKLPSAEKFSDWVCEEVLPSIRKHGVYATDNFIERSIADPDWAIAILTELKKTRAERDELNNTVNVQKTQIAELQPKSDYCDVVLKCSSLVSVSVIAKDYGYSAVAFNQLLYNYGIQYKQGDIWLPYQEYAKLGWTKTKTYVYDEENNKCNTHMYWTQKGRLGLYQFLKEKGVLPLIEQNIVEKDSGNI